MMVNEMAIRNVYDRMERITLKSFKAQFQKSFLLINLHISIFVLFISSLHVEDVVDDNSAAGYSILKFIIP